MTFDVIGPPATKGSGRAYTVRRKDGRIGVRVTADHAGLKAWERSISTAALAWRASQREPVIPPGVPVKLVLAFRLPRPHTYSSKRYASGLLEAPPHTTKPDLDKLIRAVKDALTGVCYADDSQVVCVEAIKRYHDLALGEPVGVRIRVELVESGVYSAATPAVPMVTHG